MVGTSDAFDKAKLVQERHGTSIVGHLRRWKVRLSPTWLGHHRRDGLVVRVSAPKAGEAGSNPGRVKPNRGWSWKKSSSRLRTPTCKRRDGCILNGSTICLQGSQCEALRDCGNMRYIRNALSIYIVVSTAFLKKLESRPKMELEGHIRLR